MRAFDLYTVHFLLIPYWTGLTAHRPNGSLAAFHPGMPGQPGPGTMLLRLRANRPAFLDETAIAFLWAFYIAATAALVILASRATRPRGLR
ncbi:MAG TPA: hypothetical protein VGF59_12010 [Bryobacteraceae bacterium]